MHRFFFFSILVGSSGVSEVLVGGDFIFTEEGLGLGL